MDRLKLSVAMCTYNGADFLRDQLMSIASQARLPDELIICDDHSGDGTLSVINEMVKDLPFPVHVEVNEKNLGVSKNFQLPAQQWT
mgnify:CR=1 FL=1